MDTATRLERRLGRIAADVETRFRNALASNEGAPATLIEAISHAALGGGKRLRPALVLGAAMVFDTDEERAWPGALALECIHVYSLVHDDLPCMDDDDLRRGRPT
ncbi:MAG: polyprenyl synthetase family protein, partial [Planctomycetes bacterium]|nr:polyprenyl synthetase family protein [Planctomycetota bacterium]